MQLGHTIVPGLPRIVRIFNLSDFEEQNLIGWETRHSLPSICLAKQSEKEAISIGKYQ